jgi:hypothetical protein
MNFKDLGDFLADHEAKDALKIPFDDVPVMATLQ